MNDLLKRLIKQVVFEEFPAKTPKGPFKLGQFRTLQNLRDRIQYLKTRTDAQLIGSGSSRTVFFVDNKRKVIKLSLWERGKAQNKTEADIFFGSGSTTKRYLPQIFAKAADNSWMLVEAVAPFKNAQEFHEAVGVPTKYVYMAAMYLTGGYASAEAEARAKKVYERFAKGYPWISGLVRLTKRFNLEPGDVAKWDSWGVTKRGRVVLIDYGLTPEIWQKYYVRGSSQ